MRKKIWCILPALMLLTGCSGVNHLLEQQIVQQSGIQADPKYQQYQSYSEQGKLTEDGYYSEESFIAGPEKEPTPPNTAHVTFADNAFWNIQYYSDADHVVGLDTANCYLSAGDRIFASVVPHKDIPSSSYIFSGFRIYQYDEEGGREEISTVTPDETGFVLSITEEQIGGEFSVEPIGRYGMKVVSLKDCYVDDNEAEFELSGTWTINEKPVSGSEVEISPISSYVISYEFDGSEYFYLSSEPECYYSNNEDGIVIFNKREPTDETLDYTVKLHKYIEIPIASSISRRVTVNDGPEQSVKAGTSLEISQLKYGDKVTILTNVEWNELESCRELILQSSTTLKNKGITEYKYTLIVPQKGSEFVFDPSEYTYEHGSLTFKCFGEEVTTTQYLAAGAKISYEQKTADDNYWLAEKTGTITVTTPEETRKELQKICFTPMVKVKVQLAQPEYGGKIVYYANGTRLNTNSYTATSGEELTMEFLPWEGWINNFNNGEKYKVTESNVQTSKIGTKDVNAAFKEDPEHKPELTIILAKSVGEAMEFGFSAADLNEKSIHYSKSGFLKDDYTVVDKEKIGTERGISISMGNRAIQSGTAVKVLMEMTGEDKSGNKTKEINQTQYRLIDNLSEVQTPIDIYSDSEMGSSKVWYKSVKLTISVVNIMTFTQPVSPDNATVTVRNYDTSRILKSGDILEGSEKVTITITPQSGYYVSGKNVKNDIYQDTVKFTKYLSDIQKIIDGHPIKKYCVLTLDSNDSYGTCTYKLDGNVVSGKVKVKEGQKLKLEYQITDPAYRIEGASGLFGLPVGKNDKEKTGTISIDQSYDGKTVDRSSFGIGVVKGD